MKKKGDVSLIKVIIGVVLGAIILLIAYSLASKIISPLLGSGANQKETAASYNFDSLIQRINFSLQDPEPYSMANFAFNIPDGYLIIGFDKVWDENMEVETCGTHDKAFKPTRCGNKACICLYKDNNGFRKAGTKDKDVIKCEIFEDILYILGHETNPGEFFAGVKERPQPTFDRVFGLIDSSDKYQYLFMYGKCGSLFTTRQIYVEKFKNELLISTEQHFDSGKIEEIYQYILNLYPDAVEEFNNHMDLSNADSWPKKAKEAQDKFTLLQQWSTSIKGYLSDDLQSKKAAEISSNSLTYAGKLNLLLPAHQKKFENKPQEYAVLYEDYLKQYPEFDNITFIIRDVLFYAYKNQGNFNKAIEQAEILANSIEGENDFRKNFWLYNAAQLYETELNDNNQALLLYSELTKLKRIEYQNEAYTQLIKLNVLKQNYDLAKSWAFQAYDVKKLGSEFNDYYGGLYHLTEGIENLNKKDYVSAIDDFTSGLGLSQTFLRNDFRYYRGLAYIGNAQGIEDTSKYQSEVGKADYDLSYVGGDKNSPLADDALFAKAQLKEQYWLLRDTVRATEALKIYQQILDNFPDTSLKAEIYLAMAIDNNIAFSDYQIKKTKEYYQKAIEEADKKLSINPDDVSAQEIKKKAEQFLQTQA